MSPSIRSESAPGSPGASDCIRAARPAPPHPRRLRSSSPWLRHHFSLHVIQFRRMHFRSLLLFLAALPLAAETTVLQHFTLIDGTGRAPVSNAALVIADGRI